MDTKLMNKNLQSVHLKFLMLTLRERERQRDKDRQTVRETKTDRQ